MTFNVWRDGQTYNSLVPSSMETLLTPRIRANSGVTWTSFDKPFAAILEWNLGGIACTNGKLTSQLECVYSVPLVILFTCLLSASYAALS